MDRGRPRSPRGGGAGGLKKAKLWAVARKPAPPDELRGRSRSLKPQSLGPQPASGFYNRGYETCLGGCRHRCGERDTFARAGSPAVSGCGRPARADQAAARAESDAGTGRRQTGSGAGDDSRAEAQPADPANGPPTATVVFPIFPGAQFLGSYNAGMGQRYYLYGTRNVYLDVVTFYRTSSRIAATEVFTAPATHMFQQRFREETMAFPPGVTVKDWTYQSKGYPNPRAGAQPERFPTVIMIVPPPPAPAQHASQVARRRQSRGSSRQRVVAVS